MQPEPWLRGTLTGLHPAIAPTLYSFEQALEDVTRWTEGLTTEQIWEHPHGLAPGGFQLRHIAGSVDRLLTYALGHQLSPDQLAELKIEMEPGASRDELLEYLRQRLADAGATIRAMDPAILEEPRKVGRKGLPTTVIGLLVHIAEHTQRHVGQAIITAKLARNGAQ